MRPTARCPSAFVLLTLAVGLTLGAGTALAKKPKVDNDWFAWSIRKDLPESVEEQLKAGARIAPNPNCEEKNCLFHAVSWFAWKSLPVLLKHAKKTEIDALTSKGPVLALLLRGGILEMPEKLALARLFFERGASPTLKDPDGFTQGELACIWDTEGLKPFYGAMSRLPGKYHVGEYVWVDKPGRLRVPVQSRCGSVYGLVTGTSNFDPPRLRAYHESELSPGDLPTVAQTPTPRADPPRRDPPAEQRPAEAKSMNHVVYYAAIYCAGQYGENSLKAYTIYVQATDRSSESEILSAVRPAIDQLKAETAIGTGGDDGGRWCFNGYVAARMLGSQSYDNFIWDMGQALQRGDSGWLPADWYRNYKFSWVYRYGEIDARK